MHRRVSLLVSTVLACASEPATFSGVTRDASPDRAVVADVARDDVADAPSDVQFAREAGDGCATAVCDPRPTGCAARETCNNGLDDDCDGAVDGPCPCIPGTVQDCAVGPPGRRGVGACRGGTQRCEGVGEFGRWGACSGAVGPADEACNGLDDDCNGCVDDGPCCAPRITCPAPGDPSTPDGRPFVDYPLRGERYFAGEARAWRWRVEGGPCDVLLPRPSFTLSGDDARDAVFHPTLSGDYRVTLTVTARDGEVLTCAWVVHVAGPGLRVELCWDTATVSDLDLYLHDPRSVGAWFSSTAPAHLSVTDEACNWSNCEAVVRGFRGHRADWGYDDSPLSACASGPHGTDWTRFGRCPNPRLDIDNNLEKARGMPENINVDTPADGARYRIMVANVSGTAARPLINVFCDGRLRATLGAAPDTLPDFTGPPGTSSIGAMWRAADVITHVDARGATTGCDVTPLHPEGAAAGYRITRDDPSY